jgi:hypothetical protein
MGSDQTLSAISDNIKPKPSDTAASRYNTALPAKLMKLGNRYNTNTNSTVLNVSIVNWVMAKSGAL